MELFFKFQKVGRNGQVWNGVLAWWSLRGKKNSSVINHWVETNIVGIMAKHVSRFDLCRGMCASPWWGLCSPRLRVLCLVDAFRSLSPLIKLACQAA